MLGRFLFCSKVHEILHVAFNLGRENCSVFFFPAGLCLFFDKTSPSYWVFEWKAEKTDALKRKKHSSVFFDLIERHVQKLRHFWAKRKINLKFDIDSYALSPSINVNSNTCLSLTHLILVSFNPFILYHAFICTCNCLHKLSVGLSAKITRRLFSAPHTLTIREHSSNWAAFESNLLFSGLWNSSMPL